MSEAAAGGGYDLRAARRAERGAARRRRAARLAASPGTDVQSSGGGDYGLARADAYVDRRAERVQAGRRTDAQTSGGAYGLGDAFGLTGPFGPLAVVPFNPRRELAQQALSDLIAGRPFDPARVGEAIDWAIAGSENLKALDSGRVGRREKNDLLGWDAGVRDSWRPLDETTGGWLGIDDMSGEDLRSMSNKTGIESAGLKVLEQTTRPLHAIAGTTNALLRGERVDNALGAGIEGLIDNKPVTFGDVLRTAGAPGWLAGGAGLVLDIGLDPTTYLSLGATAPGKVAARRAGQAAAERAAGAGMTETGQATVARAAERKAAEAAPDNRGWTFGLRAFGKEVKTSGQGTAAVSRALRIPGLAAAVRETPGFQTAGRLLSADFQPAGVTPAANQAVRDAQRIARAKTNIGVRRAQQRGVRLLADLRPADYSRVIDAIEAGTIGRLPEGLADVARRLRDDYRYINRVERRSGIAGRPLADYFPHVSPHDFERSARKRRRGRAARLPSSERRMLRSPLAEIREESPGLFSEQLPLVHASRLASSARGVADAEFLRAVAASGRPLTRDAIWDEGTEAIYKVSRTGLTKIDRKAKVDPKAGGQFVILNEALADDALRSIARRDTPEANAGRWIDRNAIGPVKTALTVVNPQYHWTNLFGDTFNAYLGDARVRDFVSSWRAMPELVRREKAGALFGQLADPDGKGVKIQGETVSFGRLLDEAEQQGAVRTGFMARDLPELIDAQHRMAVKLGQGAVAKRTRRTGRVLRRMHPIEALREAGTYREDFVRLASYIGARRRGMTPNDAARHVNRQHFDYDRLTMFERGVLRRVFPFYTWTRNNVPLQVKTLVTRPGKYATLQKVREEGANLAGLPENYEDQLPGYDQRGLPIPIPGLGLLYPKLPVMDLNRLPGNTIAALAEGDLGALPAALSADAGDQVDMNLSMLNPLLKTPVELGLNTSFFFREPIDPLAAQTEGAVTDLTPAPGFADDLPGFLQDLLGVDEVIDKRTGEKVAAWSPKAEYMFGLVPFSATAMQVASDSPSPRGWTSNRRALGYMTGLKTKPWEPETYELDAAYARRAELEARMERLRDQGASKKRNGDYTKEYALLLKENRNLNRSIYKLKKKRGDKILPTDGAPPKRPVDTGEW